MIYDGQQTRPLHEKEDILVRLSKQLGICANITSIFFHETCTSHELSYVKNRSRSRISH